MFSSWPAIRPRRQPVREAAALSAELRIPHLLAHANIGLGALQAGHGDPDVGLTLAELGYARFEATGAAFAETRLSLNVTYNRARIAAAFEAAGRPAEALAQLELAIAVAEQTGGRWFEPELHRLRGEWLLRHADAAEAEAEFDKAIDVAIRQNARLWELRAATSLASLHASQRRLDRARDTLAPVYAWFTEGLDRPDLRNAGALLAGLPS